MGDKRWLFLAAQILESGLLGSRSMNCVLKRTEFSRLQRLVFFSCQYLQETPYEIREIATMLVSGSKVLYRNRNSSEIHKKSSNKNSWKWETKSSSILYSILLHQAVSRTVRKSSISASNMIEKSCM